MRPLIIANVETIEASPFLVAVLYDQDGQRLDELILPFESYELSLLIIRELAERNGVESFELWTSDNRLYLLSLQTPGVAGVIKHTSDTADTGYTIGYNADILKELHDIKLLVTKPPLPRWRAFLVGAIRKILKQIEGDGKYEI
ncbi:hypothetical protein [Aneurinibacillus sp. REN35]|uniref:hypothetical protein n=1 Tax=Aneurinibacillus sp. REN35 TaxID=3237286 RepID=UPI00352898B2